MTFQEWLKRVDFHLTEICGLTHRCLADFPSHDLYDDEVEPLDAAHICLEDYNDFPLSEWLAQ